MGPRGLSVFLRLCANLAQRPGPPVTVHLVDPYPPGPGRVWRTDQPGCLLMNTVASQVTVYPDESVEMAGPLVTGPSLWEWVRTAAALPSAVPLDERFLQEARRLHADAYPSRRLYGAYLRWAFLDAVSSAPCSLNVVVHATRALRLDGGGGMTGSGSPEQQLTLENGTVLGGLRMVVLTQGHTPVSLSATERARAGFAERTRLTYLPPGNPADADLSGIAAGEAVILSGLGLCFFDYMALLTTGRGGRFQRRDGQVTYVPSGHEPRMICGSRRGIPYVARGRNEKGPCGRHEPQVLTAALAGRLRGADGTSRRLDFRREIWPLIAKEVETVYYTRLVARRTSEAVAEQFRRHYLPAPWHSRTEETVRAAAGIAPGETWDWEKATYPHRDRSFTDAADFRRWLLDHLTADIAQAGGGNLGDPTKAALDVLRDLRNEVRMAIDHGGLSSRSHAEDLDGWYTPLNAFLSIGPPVRRIEEMAALIRAGLLEPVGPAATVDCCETQGTFTVHSPAVPGSLRRAHALIEARLPRPDVRRTADPLLGYLLRTQQGTSYRIRDADGSTYDTGGLQVTCRPYQLVSRHGYGHPGVLAFGVPTEGVHWGTAAGARPGVNSVSLADADAVACAVLSCLRRSRRAPAEHGAPHTVRPEAPHGGGGVPLGAQGTRRDGRGLPRHPAVGKGDTPASGPARANPGQSLASASESGHGSRPPPSLRSPPGQARATAWSDRQPSGGTGRRTARGSPRVRPRNTFCAEPDPCTEPGDMRQECTMLSDLPPGTGDPCRTSAAAARDSAEDSGLLTPVRASTPIEAAVSDRAWVQAMLDAEAALARSQARLGTVPESAAAAITDAARAGDLDLPDLARRARAAANPVVPLVQDLATAVHAACPAATRFVHLGSTSQDILDTAAMLVSARGIALILHDLDQAADGVAVLAARHRDDLMAGRTLTQHATPITFGLKAAGWLLGLLEARGRLDEVGRTRLPVQLGGAAGTMAGYLECARDGDPAAPPPAHYAPDLTETYARELGLSAPLLPWHTRRTPMADLAHALSVTAGSLGKIATDVLSLARTETAEINELGGPGHGASSAMPQKRNPVLATLVRTAALQVPPLAAILLQSMAAEDERPAGAWHAEWMPLRECLRLVGGAARTAADLCARMAVNPARMRANLETTGALMTTERLVHALRARYPDRSAASAVAQACHTALTGQRPLVDALLDVPEIRESFSAADIDGLLDPSRYLGASAELVDRALEHHAGQRDRSN
ncbi:3-carboxy-cis,cis-muconate cycloisomerase family FAD/NAD(P)-binding protein [Streptomyces albospinus]|nr:3-carboxy-cis,cis-muconate cycloisomerase family FAD/NAD(P)-binding protein [Streptomyces albospinus]